MRSARQPICSRVRYALIGVFIAAQLGCLVYAQRVDPEIQGLRVILSKPEAEIDLARVKLTVDRMVDPSIDIEVNLQKLDDMAADVRKSVGVNPTSLKTASMLRSYMFDAGIWNGQQPFRYDLGDPLGRNLSNKLMSTYLTTKKGNCISMPALFVLLAQKLGLEATFAQSPGHFFVKYRDEAGVWYNLETTSGGHQKSDESYQRDTPMTPQALKNGIYMRPLSKKESIVTALIDPLLDKYKNRKNPERIIALADLVLEYHPKDVNAMVNKGYAYFLMLQRDFLQKYPKPRDIPVVDRPRFEEFDRSNRAWYEKAEALGWREPDADADARYVRMVKNVKPN